MDAGGDTGLGREIDVHTGRNDEDEDENRSTYIRIMAQIGIMGRRSFWVQFDQKRSKECMVPQGML